MADSSEFELVRRRYMEAHGACPKPTFCTYTHVERAERPRAALGFHRAGAVPLYLERYLAAPVDAVVSATLGRKVARESIIEIGNLAARNTGSKRPLKKSSAPKHSAQACIVVCNRCEIINQLIT